MKEKVVMALVFVSAAYRGVCRHLSPFPSDCMILGFPIELSSIGFTLERG